MYLENNIQQTQYLENVKDKINKLYPDIDINIIDNELLENIIFNIIQNDSNNIKNNIFTENLINNNQPNYVKNNLEVKNNLKVKNDEEKVNYEIIKENMLMSYDVIPEMSILTNLIYLNGKINGKNINIMIDTGATNCFIFKSVIDKCGLNYLIDSSNSALAQGAHGMKPTLGTIWFMEIDLELDNKNIISIPIKVDILDDYETDEENKIINEYLEKNNMVLKNNNSTNESCTETLKSHNFDLILGMTFLKSYRANIDFSSMTLTLNKNIKIKFK